MKTHRTGATPDLVRGFVALATCITAIACSWTDPPPPAPAASGVVSGRVTDPDGQGVAQATITVRYHPVAPQSPDSSVVVTTSSDGSFLARIAWPGDADLDAAVTVVATPPIDTSLQPDSTAGVVRLRFLGVPGTLAVEIPLASSQ